MTGGKGAAPEGFRKLHKIVVVSLKTHTNRIGPTVSKAMYIKGISTDYGENKWVHLKCSPTAKYGPMGLFTLHWKYNATVKVTLYLCAKYLDM